MCSVTGRRIGVDDEKVRMSGWTETDDNDFGADDFWVYGCDKKESLCRGGHCFEIVKPKSESDTYTAVLFCDRSPSVLFRFCQVSKHETTESSERTGTPYMMNYNYKKSLAGAQPRQEPNPDSTRKKNENHVSSLRRPG